MRVHDLITTAGGERANEDRVGHRGNLAWAIDGATDLYQDAALPASSDVQWLVDLLGERLAAYGEAEFQGEGPNLLAELADEVSRRQDQHGLPSGRLPPACSVVVAIDQGSTYEITRIGDATAVVTGATTAVLGTEFFDGRERTAVDDAHGNGRTPEQVRAGMLQRRLQTMTAGDTESVFSGHPRRKLRPHTIRGRWLDVDQILLCTDGLARLVTDYAIYPDWPEVLDGARQHGLAYLEKLIREHERGPTTGMRFKQSDDIAAIVLSSEENLRD